MRGVHAQRLHARQVFLAVVAQRGQRHGVCAQLPQAIRDVAGATTVLAAQGGNQKRHVEDVQLAGQDLLGKATLERHDGVESKRSANKNGHGEVDQES
ncbi:hypothetical protein D9M69_633950 [compost metagenome]